MLVRGDFYEKNTSNFFSGYLHYDPSDVFTNVNAGTKCSFW